MTMAAGERPAVVTGASSGIGEATGRLLAANGHPVVLGARRLDNLERIAAAIRDDGGTAHAVALDLADDASVAGFAKHAEELVGPIDVLVSNGSHIEPGDTLGMDRESFQRHLDVNVNGTRALAQLLGAGMVERHHGDLVFVTSQMTYAPRPGMAGYVASKWALEGLVTALQMELEGTGVRVSSVRPGATLTEMGWSWDPAVTGELLALWAHWGLQRHMHFMSGADVAYAIGAVVAAPPGVSFTVVEVEPVAPYEPPQQQEGS
ncbi:MAG: SDR family oxidoreductase [Frankiaceae bacterium]|nr:SDR family oxidoreductase [Frankiaceae bacterium]MBV9872279.1 SDR family oxidoreductase [Frankiaceae bacterium]